MKNLGFISLGTEVTIEVEGVEERFKSRMIGVDGERFLILRTPVSIAAGLLRTNLTAGTKLIIRYLHQGTVWGFRSSVIQPVGGEIGVVFAAFPKEVENYDLRAAQRVEAHIPVMLVNGEKSVEGMIVDLSATGARLLFETSLIKELALSPSAPVTLLARFDTKDEPTRLESIVRSLREDSERTSLGLQYDSPSPEAIAAISSYIDRVMAFAGS